MQKIARPHQGDHRLAEALWATGWYEQDAALRTAARELAGHLAVSSCTPARWIGRDATRAFRKADA